MMPSTKKKPAEGLLIGLLAGKPKGKPEPEMDAPEAEEGEPEEESGPDYELMAQEVLDAIESGDAAALGEAMRAFVESCSE